MKLNDTTKNALVKRTCTGHFPLLLKYIPNKFTAKVLEKATRSILNFVIKRDRGERGVGFNALGKLIHQVSITKNKALQDCFSKFLDEIMHLVR